MHVSSPYLEHMAAMRDITYLTWEIVYRIVTWADIGTLWPLSLVLPRTHAVSLSPTLSPHSNAAARASYATETAPFAPPHCSICSANRPAQVHDSGEECQPMLGVHPNVFLRHSCY